MPRSPPTNQIECLPFSGDTFIKRVRDAAEVPDGDETAPQIDYLARYLGELGAKTLVVERHYVDRHYIEEVSLYYSTSLTPPPNSCVRIHVLGSALELKDLLELVAEASSGDEGAVAERLQSDYLGYVVVRPLPGSPIGRSVVSPWRDDDERQFPTSLDYPAHLMGLELSARGLAFQQQDTSVAACATTALWVALQRVCRHEGGRAPTPAAISEAAVRHFLPQGRPYPNSGLTIEQMCDALRKFEFAPDLFKPEENAPFFVAVRTYLRSGIPVILGLASSGGLIEEHAVTVVGYRDGLVQGGAVEGSSVELLFPTIEELYVHDDRLGPYARAFIYPPDDPSEDEATKDEAEFLAEDGSRLKPSVTLKIQSPASDDTFSVVVALAPLYRKLRANASELWVAGMRHEGFVGDLLGVDVLTMETFFQRSGDYLSSLYRANCPADRLVSFQQRIAPSRYVGIVRWWSEDEPRLDFVWDTTDRIRWGAEKTSLLAVVALEPGSSAAADWLATKFKCLAG